MRNWELSFELMDKFQAKKKRELAIASALVNKVEPVLDKEGFGTH